MKIELLKLFKISFLILIVILGSCTKDSDNIETSLPIPHLGSLLGNVKLINKYRAENLNFDDVKIELIDSLNAHRLVDLGTAGTFLIDSICFGKILLIIDKPGYGVVDTLSFNLQKSIDTLSTIILAEELPLSYNSFSIYYGNNMIHYSRSTTYQTNDSYLVGELICFGKNPNVSLNNCAFFMGTGSNSDVSYINWTINSATSSSLTLFTDNGLLIGDMIYSVCYPIIDASFTLYNDHISNFDIISYKIGNPSNVSNFVLQE